MKSNHLKMNKHTFYMIVCLTAMTLMNLNANAQNNGKSTPKSGTSKKPAEKNTAKTKKPVASNCDVIETPSGLKILMLVKNPTGEKAKKGDQIEAHYHGTLANGKKFDSSRDRNQTFKFNLGEGRVIAGWDEAFAILRKGERAMIIVPPSIGYGAANMGSIPSNSTLYFDVELVNFESPEPYVPYDVPGLDTITLPSGLKYIVIKNGVDTAKPKPGSHANIFYAGYLTDGTKFDGNLGTFEGFDLDVYNAGVIQGWKEMLKLMHEGMKVRVIIPGDLAYGSRGYPGVIPPNATLIFDMYMKELN
ncbi:MAG TPA: FKBP-type peptidyl-prolyl cis-trans isomerase [Bacteroidia bacterium]